MVTIRVPATTANLGPGFDCLGLALDLFNDYSFSIDDQLRITGCEAQYAHENNLVYRAYRAALERHGMKSTGLRLNITTRIPPARGLGSSAACVVAGILGADALHALIMDKQSVFELATHLEGHPDNVAPALYGGLRLSMMEGGAPHSVRSPVHPAWRFLLLVPDFELDTHTARHALPRLVPLEDAVYNVAHTAFLLKALEEGDLPFLRLALKDRLHQRARLPLIAGAREIMERAEALGAACCVSGAGPSLLCVHQDASLPGTLANILISDFPRFSALPLTVCHEGAKTERTFSP